MNILITGAGGFIGTHLHNHLKKGHSVSRVFSSLQPTSKRNAYAADLTKSTEVANLIHDLSSTKFEVIINLASAMSSQESIEDLKILKKNIDIVEGVVSLAKKFKPGLFINFSSMAVYPNVSGLFSEDSLPRPQTNPDCIYGLSKYCSEVILDFLLRNENVRIVH